MYGGGGSTFNSRGVHDDDGTKPGPSPHSQGVLAALQVVRYPTLPSLEQFKSVDVQVGGRLFQQVPLKVRTELWTNLTNQTLTGRDSAMRYPGLQAQVSERPTAPSVAAAAVSLPADPELFHLFSSCAPRS